MCLGLADVKQHIHGSGATPGDQAGQTAVPKVSTIPTFRLLNPIPLYATAACTSKCAKRKIYKDWNFQIPLESMVSLCYLKMNVISEQRLEKLRL